MTTLRLILFLCLISASTFGQTAQPEYQPYFSAIVVKELAVAQSWYQSVLKLTIKEEMRDPANAYKIAILESPNFQLELLELRGSLVPAELLKGKPEGTQIQGHFKIGFKVLNMDEWLKHLSALKVDVPQIWTEAKTHKRNFLIHDPDGNLIQFFDQ